jgi:hypothetical protein
MMRKAILAAAMFLGGCGGGGETLRASGLEFREIAPDAYVVVIDPHADVAATETAIRKHCATEPVCTVLGWTDAGAAARALPMNDREGAALAVRFERNDPAGMDDMMWDCVRFRAAKAPCLPKS